MANAIKVGNVQIAASKVPVSQGGTQGSGTGMSAARGPDTSTIITDASGARVPNPAAPQNQPATPVPATPPAPTPPDPEVPTNAPSQTPASTSPELQSYEKAKQNLADGGLSGSDLSAAQDSLANKYGQAHTNAQASGQPAPQDAGAARAATATLTPASQPDTSVADAYVAQDPAMSKLMSGITELLNPQTQTTTLLQDYDKLYKQSDLGEINKEIIDANTVINGTEGDIRNEIQSAGGMGTDSQVQAMALSRNKSLLVRYNQLVQMKTDATNQLNTMMQLDSSDKQMQQTKVTSQIDAMFKMATFQQQAQTNIREAFNSMVSKVGYAGAYSAYAADPKQLSMIEQTMGMTQGGLKALAEQPDLDMEAKKAQIAASNANTAQSYSAIAKDNYDMGKATQAQTAAAQQGANTADTVLTAVNTALKQVNPISSGTIGGFSSGIPGLPSNNLKSTIATIKSNLAFTELSKMRAASPTGGALGAISDKEEELLSSTVANLDVGQSTAQLKTNLANVQQHYISYLTSIGYGYDAATGTVIQP